MKILNYFKKVDSRVWKSVVFGEVLIISAMIFMVPKEACAACAQTLYSCPASITVWNNATIPFAKYGNGTLPNGHAYCGYYGSYMGDSFAGAFDRVAGQVVTFARTLSSCQDASVVVEGTEPGMYYDCTTAYVAVPMNPLNQGAKCVNRNYSDPLYAGSAGTDSNYYIQADCPGSYSYWAAFSNSGLSLICLGGTPSQPSCKNISPFSVSSVGEGTQTCVDVTFQ